MSTWNRAQATVQDALDARVAAAPDTEYLDFDGRSMTARELDDQAERAAATLGAHGIGHGDRVAMLADNGPEIVIAFFATLKIGATAVPINTAYKGSFLAHQLTDSGASALFIDPKYANRIVDVADEAEALRTVVCTAERGACAAIPSVGNLGWSDLVSGAPRAGDVPATAVKPSDLATIIYTAGTTGTSKGCMLSHNYLVTLARQIAETWQRRPDDVVWTPLPLFHLNAWVIAVLGTLVVGGRASIASRFSVSGFWGEINRTGATIASLIGSPAIFIAQADDDAEQAENESLRLVAAAPMSAQIADVYRDRFGIQTFSAGYGVTEASLISRLAPGDANKPGAAGRRNDSEFDVRIFDDDDVEVEPGAVGEIVVRPKAAHVMFEGYWGRPEATLAAGRNWWFHTGDLGRIDADGFLFFVDRKKDYLRRRGENISSFEMEAAFLRHPGIAEVAVHAVVSDAGEDDVKVTAVLGDAATATPEDLLRWSFDQVPYFAVPRYVEIRTELPRNPVGRVLKYELREDGVTEATFDREAAGLEVPR